MKQIIVLKGAGGTGKTHTLNILVGLLDKSKEVTTDKRDRDYKKYLYYRGHKIAIITGGDTKEKTEDTINCTIQRKCITLVTAVCIPENEEGEKLLEEFAHSNSATIQWVKQEWSHKDEYDVECDRKNSDQATKLKTLIDNFIDKL